MEHYTRLHTHPHIHTHTWQKEWEDIMERTEKDGAYLTQIHLFVLTHVIRRPIIVFAHTGKERERSSYVYVCMYMCMYVYIYVCMYLYVHVCMHACICMCVWAFAFIVLPSCMWPGLRSLCLTFRQKKCKRSFFMCTYAYTLYVVWKYFVYLCVYVYMYSCLRPMYVITWPIIVFARKVNIKYQVQRKEFICVYRLYLVYMHACTLYSISHRPCTHQSLDGIGECGYVPSHNIQLLRVCVCIYIYIYKHT